MGLPPGEAGIHAPPHLGTGVPEVQLLQHIVVHPDHVDERQGATFAVAVQGVGEGELPLELTLRSKIHQDLIFDAPAGVGGQTNFFVWLECGYPFD